jgi:hypothetical protein
MVFFWWGGGGEGGEGPEISKYNFDLEGFCVHKAVFMTKRYLHIDFL